MTNETPNERYHYLIPLLSAANFLAAFGAGMILGQDHLFREWKIEEINPVEPFAIGATLGLGLLLLLRFGLPQRVNSIGGWLSIVGGLISLFMVIIAWSNSIPTQIQILLLLSLRFCFWFVARVLRPDLVAGHKQKISWVELFYFLAFISGMLSAHVIPAESVSIERFFLIDCLLQIVAGLADLLARRWAPAQVLPLRMAPTGARLPYDRAWYARVVTAVVALTIGTQAVVFLLRDLLGVKNNNPYKTVALAVFYLGVASAATAYGLARIRLEWPYKTEKIARFATLFLGEGRMKANFSFPLWSGISAALLALTIVSNGLRLDAENPLQLAVVTAVFYLLFIGIAAFMYEIMALAIFDHIGEQLKKSNRGGMVANAYGFLAVGFTVTLLFFRVPNLDGAQKHQLLFMILLICLIVANVAMARPLRRKSKQFDSSDSHTLNGAAIVEPAAGLVRESQGGN